MPNLHEYPYDIAGGERKHYMDKWYALYVDKVVSGAMDTETTGPGDPFVTKYHIQVCNNPVQYLFLLVFHNVEINITGYRVYGGPLQRGEQHKADYYMR